VDESGEAIAVEIAYVLLTCVGGVVLVIGVEWSAWAAFSLKSAAWHAAGVGVLLAAVAGLIMRAGCVLHYRC
jgi:hypothetical protein